MTNKRIIGVVASLMFSTILALDAPYNVYADGVYLDVYGDGSVMAPAVTWTWLDDNESSGECADGSSAMAGVVNIITKQNNSPFWFDFSMQYNNPLQNSKSMNIGFKKKSFFIRSS